MENFRIVNIEINVFSPLCINLKINLIFSSYPEKCIKCNQSEWRAIRNQEIKNFRRHLMKELSLVEIRWGYPKRGKKGKLKAEIKSVHSESSD